MKSRLKLILPMKKKEILVSVSFLLYEEFILGASPSLNLHEMIDLSSKRILVSS
jgi:hypothetical protein